MFAFGILHFYLRYLKRVNLFSTKCQLQLAAHRVNVRERRASMLMMFKNMRLVKTTNEGGKSLEGKIFDFNMPLLYSERMSLWDANGRPAVTFKKIGSRELAPDGSRVIIVSKNSEWTFEKA